MSGNTRIGLDEDDGHFYQAPDCANCKDTGRVTDHEGQDYECGCVAEERKQMLDMKAEQDAEARKEDAFDIAGDR